MRPGRSEWPPLGSKDAGQSNHAGLVALAAGHWLFTPADLRAVVTGWRLADPVAFARAGLMRNAACLGAVAGMAAGAAAFLTARQAARAG